MNLEAVNLTNAFGLAIILTTIVCCGDLIRSRRKDIGALRFLILVVCVSSVIHSILSFIDGIEGDKIRLLSILGNSWLYAAGLWVYALFAVFLIYHLYGDDFFSQKLILILLGSAVVFSSLIFVNILHPFLFYLSEDNVYSRTIWSYLFQIIPFLYAVTSVAIFIHCTRTKKNVQFLPIAVFLLETIGGYVVQGIFYGSSIFFPMTALATCSIFMYLQNESVYVDSLTGMRNRAYLFGTKAHNSMGGGIIMDLNNFKSINDSFGHMVGDQALREVAGTLQAVSIHYGIVIRYAGDEFVLLSKDGREETLQKITREIDKKLDTINKRPKRRYVLSLSYGYGTYNADEETLDEFIIRIDRKMYESKRRYYQEHRELSRRKGD